MAHWHYQPVYVDEHGERTFGLCEVYVDDEGRLEGWTESMSIYPSGNDLPDLSGDLVQMLVDCWRWMPVPFDSLRSGMVLQRAMTADECETLARMIEGWAHNMSQASAHPTAGGAGE